VHLESQPVSARGSAFDPTGQHFCIIFCFACSCSDSWRVLIELNSAALIRALHGLGDLMTPGTEGHDEWYAPLTKSQHSRVCVHAHVRSTRITGMKSINGVKSDVDGNHDCNIST
jgi:hypothetical protein